MTILETLTSYPNLHPFAFGVEHCLLNPESKEELICLEFRCRSSLHRKIVHEIAEYYGLYHETINLKEYIGIRKTDEELMRYLNEVEDVLGLGQVGNAYTSMYEAKMKMHTCGSHCIDCQWQYKYFPKTKLLVVGVPAKKESIRNQYQGKITKAVFSADLPAGIGAPKCIPVELKWQKLKKIKKELGLLPTPSAGLVLVK